MGAGLAFGEAAGGSAEAGVIPAALNSPGENMLVSRVCWAEKKQIRGEQNNSELASEVVTLDLE